MGKYIYEGVKDFDLDNIFFFFLYTGNGKSIINAEKAKAEKAHKAERAETDRQLNNAYANEKEFVKRSRAVRKGLRGTKRGI